MKKIISAISIFIIAFTMLAIGNTVKATTTWDGENSNLVISRDVNGIDQNVTNDFTYTITPAANNPATVSGMPTTATVSFNNEAPDASYVATKSNTINLSNAQFTQLGVYQYTITETGSTDSTLYPVDSTNTYTLRVEVKNELDNNGVPTGNFIITKYLVDNNKSGAESKVDEADFENNAAKAQCISLSKTVSGDLADTTEYFTFSVNVEGPSGTTYAVSGGSNSSNPQTITANTATTVYLKAGETITIGNNDLIIGNDYTITETAATGYTTTVNAGGQDKGTTNSTGTLKVSSTQANNAATFNNDKSSTTFTGVLFSVTPYIVIVALAIALVVVFKKISNQNKED